MTAQRNYAPLDSSELVDPTYLGTGTPTGSKFLRDDQTYAVPPGTGGTFGTPALTFGTSNTNGTVDEMIRRDAQLALFDATAPVTQAFGDSAAAGSAGVAARRDHKHAMPAAAVTSSGLTQATAKLLGRTSASTGAIEEISVGSGLSLAAGSLTATGGSGSVATDTIWDAKGDLAVGTGADTASKLTAGADDTILMAESGEATGLKWVASASGSTQAFGDSAATGTADTFSRGDHKHAMPTAAITTSGLTQTTARLLGRTSASTGAVEEITVGTGLSLSAGSLTATGGSGNVATDTIWDAAGDLAVGTGADTAAKLTIGNAGAELARINGAVAWNAGTAFPTAATNDRYWRTDLGMGFHYDGTRWVSDTLYFWDLSQSEALWPLSATTTGMSRIGTIANIGSGDAWLVDCLTTFFVAGGGSALDSTHKWVGTISKIDTTNAATTLITVNIASGASSTWRTDVQSIAALLGTVATYPSLRADWAKTSTPGTLRAFVQISYRIVST